MQCLPEFILLFVKTSLETVVGFATLFNALTVFVHRRLKALRQSARSTLIAVRLVDRTSPFQLARRFARVNPIAMNAPLEKARATCN